MTAPSELDRWRDRVDEYERRRQAQRELRAELQRRRRYAKDRHHRLRLTRAGQPSTTD